MASPYLGQININAFAFPPRGWALCNGQLMAINQNQALFSLLGTFYGGNGIQTFALPDLRSRAPVHFGTQGGASMVQGERGGAESVTLNSTQLPTHQHSLNAVTDLANANSPGLALPAARGRGGLAIYGPSGNADAAMNPASVQPIGGNQAHDNMQPFAVVSFCIALQGIFPSRN